MARAALRYRGRARAETRPPGRAAGPDRDAAGPYEEYFADWFEREDIDWAVRTLPCLTRCRWPCTGRRGAVRCLETPGHPARFETRVGDNHHHFICRACGRTIDIDCATGEAPCLTPRALPSGFKATEAEVTYWGTCSNCADSAATVAGGNS